jgi:uncharacterized protein
MMGERTSYEPGTFSWADLATSDPEGAKAFYSGLFGWEIEDMPAGQGQVYSMARLDGKYVAAMSSDGAEEGIPPHWNNYVTVASVNDAAGRARELGATVMLEPFDVLEAGRMAVIQDPTGAAICLWEPRDHIGAQRVNDPGCLTWNDLSTTDPEAAERFYSELFGWAFEQVGPPEVQYWVFANKGRRNGGMRKQGEDEVGQGVPPNWMPYFTVESSERATARVEELGGGVMVPTTEVPAGKFTVVRDPQGAFFALFEGEVDD